MSTVLLLKYVFCKYSGNPNSEHLDTGHVRYSGLQGMLKLSRDEICIENLIPLVNGASVGVYFKAKNLSSV